MIKRERFIVDSRGTTAEDGVSLARARHPWRIRPTGTADCGRPAKMSGRLLAESASAKGVGIEVGVHWEGSVHTPLNCL